jgi:RHS repeat-associated protein
MIQRATATVNETSYPLYDAHGNMTAQLLKNGASFTVANEKSYDAWGAVRQDNTNSEYKGRYCANLGLVQDDESGLIYMRARYYEPSSGRFVSEDAVKEGVNYFIYVNNSPVNLTDSEGHSIDQTVKNAGWFISVLGRMCVASAILLMVKAITPWELIVAIKVATIGVYLQAIGTGVNTAFGSPNPWLAVGEVLAGVITNAILERIMKTVTLVAANTAVIGKTHAWKAGLAACTYTLLCLSMLEAPNISQ